MGLGRAWPPNALWCNWRSKFRKSR